MNGSDKIKLMILIPSLQCGGMEKYVSTVCRLLDKKRFSVMLIVLDDRERFYDPGPGVEIIDLKKSRVRHAILRIRGIVMQHQPDILFSAANHITAVLGLFRWMLPRKMALIARESSLVSSNHLNAVQPALYKRLLISAYVKIDHILCQSKAMEQDLQDHFSVPQHKMQVLYNPVEMPFAGESKIAGDGHIFISVSRLSPEKGIDMILEALALLQFSFTYYIVGDGKEKPRLQQQVQALGLRDKVVFCGQRELPFKGFAAAGLFLMASTHEGLPNSLLEAGSLGIPVVAFDAPGGIAEIVADGLSGFLVKERSAPALAAAIEKAVNFSFDRALISKKILEQFDSKRHIEQLEATLERCYAERK